MSKFDKWNEVKKRISKKNNHRSFEEMDIFNANLGQNLGFEQNGTGNQSIRPILILKKFNKNFFYAIPLSTTENRNKYFFEFEFIEDKKSVAVLSQVRNMDAKRLLNKIGKINEEDFKNLKTELKRIIDW